MDLCNYCNKYHPEHQICGPYIDNLKGQQMNTNEPRRFWFNQKTSDHVEVAHIYSVKPKDMTDIIEVIEAAPVEARIRELEETLNEVEVLKADYGTCSAHRDTLEAENERLKVYVIDPLRVDIEILEKQIKELEARIEKLRSALKLIGEETVSLRFEETIKEALAEDEEGIRE